MFKLLLFDVDGTLVEEGSNQLAQVLIHKLEELMNLGVHIVIASGRGYANLSTVFESLIPKAYFLADNGTKIYHKGEQIYCEAMDDDLILELLEALEPLPDLSPLFSGPAETLYAVDRWVLPELEEFQSQGWERVLESKSDYAEIPKPVTKISCFSRSLASHYAETLRPEWQDRFEVVLGGEFWLAFMKPGTGKGKSLRILQKRLGLEADDCVAFGDQENDVSAFQACGTAFATKDAEERVQRAAERVLPDSLDRGILRAIDDMQKAGQLPSLC